MDRETKILIIDSEPDFLETNKKEMEGYFKVLTASNAKAGLKTAKEEIPDAIVLGYLAPRGTSFQVHTELRSHQNTKNIPLLIVDVRPEEHSRKGWRRDEGMQMDAEDYLSRPVKPSELVRAIDGVIRRTSGKPIGLKEAAEYLEEALERIDRIEELLFK